MKAITSQQLEREIEVVGHIIDQLNQCLEIYHENKMHDEFKITLKDIQTCKTELRRLIAKRTVILDSE